MYGSKISISFLNNEQRVETAISLISQLYVCIKEKVGSDEVNEKANIILGCAIILGTEENATVDEVNDDDLTKVDYEECSTYGFMKDYINNYKRYIRHILCDLAEFINRLK